MIKYGIGAIIVLVGTALSDGCFAVKLPAAVGKNTSIVAENISPNDDPKGVESKGQNSIKVSVPNTFADVVEPLLASVVNISTTTKLSGKDRRLEMPNFPQGSPFEELFRHFLEEGGPAMRPRKSTSLGSGFIIAQKEISGQKETDVYIATCAHLVDGADTIHVTLHDDTDVKAEVVGQDKRTDTALLKFKTTKKMSVAKWGDSSKVRIGDWVIAIGNPFGLASTVTTGIVSTIARDISEKSGSIDLIDGFIQTDASINPGNSGGPMFNSDGEVIAVATAIVTPNGGNIGIGFGIPSAMSKRVIDGLMAHGHSRWGWIGVSIQPVSSEDAEAFGLKKTEGVIVAGVLKTGPAAAAGIKRGDIILSFNDKPITKSQWLPRIVSMTDVGQKVPLVVWRAGKEMTLSVTVGESPDQATLAAAHPKEERRTKKPTKSVLGLVLEPIKPAQIEHFGLPEDAKGVIIVSVDRSSDAEDRGLKPGDVISEVIVDSKNYTVQEPAQLEKIVGDAIKLKQNKNISLLVNRGGAARFLSLPLVPDEDRSKSDDGSDDDKDLDD